MNLFEAIRNKFLTTNVRNNKNDVNVSTNVIQDRTQSDIHKHIANNFSTSHTQDQVETERVYSNIDPFETYMFYSGNSMYDNDELVRRWREVSRQVEASEAIDEIVNDAIVLDDNEEIIRIDLTKLKNEYGDKSSEPLINAIRDSFDKFLELSDFNNNADKIFCKWFTDGVFYYESVYDNRDASKGIVDLIELSPIGMKKIIISDIKKVLDDVQTTGQYEILTDTDAKQLNNTKQYDPNKKYTFYIWDKNVANTNSFTYYNITGSEPYVNNTTEVNHVVFDDEQIVTANSGLWDGSRKIYKSYIDLAMKSINQLYLIEDAIIIYRLTHAPEKKVFKVDVGKMKAAEAERFVANMMTKYKQKKYYNTADGTVQDRKVTQAYGEDYWFMKRPDGTGGTDVEILQGTSWNLGNLDDLNYFVDKVYKSLKVPRLRKEKDAQTYIGFDSTAATINREELKFFKHIQKLRKEFISIIYDFIKKDCISRKVFAADDWKKIKNMIRIRFSNYNEFSKIQQQQVLENRLNLLDKIEPWHEKGYYSRKWIYSNILEMTDEEIEEMQQQISDEKISDINKKEYIQNEYDTMQNDFNEPLPSGPEPLPVEAGEVAPESFPFEENTPSATEETTTPETGVAPETLTQSNDLKKIKDKIIFEKLNANKDKVKENGTITINNRTFIKKDNQFIEQF